VTPETTVAEVAVRRVSTIAPHANSSQLMDVFDRDEVALVVGDDGAVQGLLAKLDLIELLNDSGLRASLEKLRS